jgi:hypothetical protein
MHIKSFVSDARASQGSIPPCQQLVIMVHVSHKPIQPRIMDATKTMAMSLSITPQFKAMLEAVARRENRS